MSTQTLIYQPQLSSFYSLAVYVLYLIALIGFLLIASREALTLEVLGIGLLVIIVICFAVYIRYQKIQVSDDTFSVVSAGFNPIDLVAPRTIKLDDLTEVNAIRMLPKDLRGSKAIPTHIEFKDTNGKTVIFNRWFHQPREITQFLQSIAQKYPQVVFNEDIQTLLTGSY